MKRYLEGFVIAGLVVIMSVITGNLSHLWSQKTEKVKNKSTDIESRHVNIWSDGTRLSGDLFYPKNLKPQDKLPTIILCHGWGGVRSHLNQYYAPEFARAGYMVLQHIPYGLILFT